MVRLSKETWDISFWTYRTLLKVETMIRLSVCSFLILISGLLYSQTGDYMGVQAPGLVPELFNPGCFTHELHTTVVFSPDGKEACWKEMGPGENDILMVKRTGNQWSSPMAVPFDHIENTGDPFYSTDGNRLFFTAMEPIDGIEKRANESIWYTDRSNNTWTAPLPVSALINSHEMHWQFSVAANGNLYFGQMDDNRDFGDIYMSRFDGADYSEPIRLGDAINSPVNEVTETTPFIALDESYLIFARSHFPAQPYTDLYVSYKQPDGTWATAVPMDNVNSPSHDLCPIVTHDGKYLFFLSMRGGSSMPYWVDADVIDAYGTGIDDGFSTTDYHPRFTLHQNFPNPFNSATSIAFDLSRATSLSVTLYDIHGSVVRQLVSDHEFDRGSYTIRWDGRNDNGVDQCSGTYICRIVSRQFSESKRILFIQ